MKTAFCTFLLILFCMALTPGHVLAGKLQSCSYNGIPLHGKVRVVSGMADFNVREVSIMGDLKVQKVTNFPQSCGQWEFVDMLEDFTVCFVNINEDFTIEFTDHFPGVSP